MRVSNGKRRYVSLMGLCALGAISGPHVLAQNIDIWQPQYSPTFSVDDPSSYYWNTTATDWTVNGAQGQTFQNGDAVYFSDLNSAGPAVMTQNVNPASVNIYVSSYFVLSDVAAAGQGSIGDYNAASPTTFTLMGPGSVFVFDQNTTSETYTGPTTLYQGTLNILLGNGFEIFTATYNFANPSVNLLNPSSTLQLAGGQLFVQSRGVAGNTGAQSFNSTLIESGSSFVTGYSLLSQGTAGGISLSTTISVGQMTRNSGGTVDFEATPQVVLPSGSTAAMFMTTTNANVNGIIGGWATYGTTDWASVSNTGNIVPLSANGGYTADAWAGGDNTDVLANDSIPILSTTNSLRFNAAAACTVSLTGVNTIASGGILMTANTGASNNTLTGGSLTSGNGEDLILTQNNTAASLTIESTITDNGSTSIGLTKSGPGAAILPALNTYTGVTTINGGNTPFSGAVANLVNPQSTGGVLAVMHLADGGLPSSIGASSNAAGNLVFNGGTLQYLGTGDTTDRLFTIAPNGATLDSSGAGPLVFSNTGSLAVSQTGSVVLTLSGSNTGLNTLAMSLADPLDPPNSPVYATSIVKSGPGTWQLIGSSTNSGPITVNGGTLILANAAGFAAGTGSFTVNNGGTLINQGIGTESGSISVNAGGTFINQGSLTGDSAIAGAAVDGVVVNNGSIGGLEANGGAVTNNGTALVEETFIGTFTNTATGNLTAGAYGFGGTIINDGYIDTLSAPDSEGGTRTTTIRGKGNFGDGAGLGGNIVSDAILAPGDVGSPGTLTFANLEIDQANSLDFRLDKPGASPANDLLSITGNLTLDPAALLAIAVTPGPDFTAGVYDLINFGSLTNNSSLVDSWSAYLTDSDPNYLLTLSFDATPDQLDLIVTPVPEPAFSGVLLLLLSGMALTRRGQRRKEGPKSG